MTPAFNAEDALARISWQGRSGHLGVELVNRDRERFFMFAEVYVCMMRRPNEYVVVKHRDRKTEKAINHHGGAIWGDVEIGVQTSVITLYFGALYKDIEYCPENYELRHVIGTQRYRVDTAWLQDLLRVVERQHSEQREYERLAMEAGVTPLQASFIGG